MAIRDYIRCDFPLAQFIHCCCADILWCADNGASQFGGEHIHCDHGGPKKLRQAIANICWKTSTFTIPDAFDRQFMYPGTDDAFVAREYHNYSQWVSFTLFFQAVIFYFPNYLWSIWECELLKYLSMGLKDATMRPNEKRRKKRLLIGYLKRYVKVITNHLYYVFKCLTG